MILTSKRAGLTLALFSILALIPMSCGLFCQDSCGCGPSAPPKDMIIKSMQLFTLTSNRQAVNPMDTLPFNQVFKAIQVKDFEVKILAESTFAPALSYGLAYACSPSPLYSRDEITSIKVINNKQVSLADGTTIRPTDDITRLFGMGNFYSGNLISVEEFIGTGKTVILEENYKLGFTKSPGKPVKLEFEVKVIFKSGKEILIEDQVLNIR
jgi:hypothetical protein